MDDSCPATPLILNENESKSPIRVHLSSPESEGFKSPSRDSPDSHCVICLGRLRNKSFTDSCLHQFCFQCLLQWSKVKAECPLCKQSFKSIIHNVRSNLDYDQYHIEPGEPHCVLSDLMHSFNFDFISADRRFRYRSTMTREYFRELAESFLTRNNLIPDDFYQISPIVPPIDSSISPSVRYSNRMNRRRQHRLRQRGTTDFRRNIYSRDLWVQDLVDISGRYRECSPQFYRENPAQIHRIIPWLNREVNVLLEDGESQAAYILTQIISNLSQHSIRSREFRELVEPYFGSRTDHFIHELYTFARSVYDIAGFDQHAVYGPNPYYANEIQEISSSNEDSDVEILEEDVTKSEKTRKASSQCFKKILLKRAKNPESHEPVAGPSGVSSVKSPEHNEECESDSSDIKILDYVKPEPEIITLSSGEDSLVENPANENSVMIIKKPKDSRNLASSDQEWVPSNEMSKVSIKSKKGKCKSNGVGLKGGQKNKFLKNRRSRSSSDGSLSSMTNSSFSDEESRSSENSSPCRSSRKPKRKKLKSSRKKYKKKVNKSSHKVSESKRRSKRDRSCSDVEKKSRTKKKVKSCVIVPRPLDLPYSTSLMSQNALDQNKSWYFMPNPMSVAEAKKQRGKWEPRQNLVSSLAGKSSKRIRHRSLSNLSFQLSDESASEE